MQTLRPFTTCRPRLCHIIGTKRLPSCKSALSKHHPNSSSGSCSKSILLRSLPRRSPTAKSHQVCTMASSSTKSVLVPIANGSEEIEAVTIIDTLRRAGADVTVASVESDLQVTMSRNVKLVADKSIEDVKSSTFDLIALPGGMPGAERLRDSLTLNKLLETQQKEDRFLTAICAAPAVVLEAKGFLKGKPATSHPGFVDKLSDQSQINTRVVVSGKTVTSRGPGTSLEFALTLVRLLFGENKADEVAKPMVVTDGLVY